MLLQRWWGGCLFCACAVNPCVQEQSLFIVAPAHMTSSMPTIVAQAHMTSSMPIRCLKNPSNPSYCDVCVFVCVFVSWGKRGGGGKFTPSTLKWASKSKIWKKTSKKNLIVQRIFAVQHNGSRSIGMILASSARGPRFESWNSPFFFNI